MVGVSRSAVILRNIASNWMGFVINAAITLALTPYVLYELGVARYGIWTLTSSIVGYYGFLDLGFRAGVTQYLTRYLALRDFEKASDCTSSAVVALSLIGICVVALSIGGSYVAPSLFAIPDDMAREAFWCILIVGISSAVQIIFSPYASVFTAMQRFDLTNLIAIGTRLLNAGGVVAAISMGYGLIGLSIVMGSSNIVEYLIRWRVAYRLLPELDVAWRRSNLAQLCEIASFGGWNLLNSINSYVYYHVPNILIGAFMPVAAVGYYALAIGLLKTVKSVLSPVGQVIYPVAVEIHTRGNEKELLRLYHDGSRLMILAMISVVLAAMFWSEDFYRLWIGEEYVSGDQFHSVALLFQILLISVFTTYISNIAGQILVGSGGIRMIAIALICGSALNLMFCVILIGPYGLAGIAMSTVIASVLIDLIVIPVLLQKMIGLSVKNFLLSACVRPVAVGALQSIIIVTIRLTGNPEDWHHLIIQGLLAGVGSVATVLVVGLTTGERERYIIGPIQRLFGC